MALEALPSSGAIWLENRVIKSTIAAFSTQQSLFPASNLLSPIRSETWRTTTSSADSYVVFDAGSVVTPVCLGLVDINFSAGAKIRFRGSDDSAQVTNPVFFDLELYPEDPIQRVLKWYPGTTPTSGSMGSGRRFWGVRILPATFGSYSAVDELGNPADYFEIGKVWIGTSYESVVVSDDIQITPNDPSSREHAYGRAQWTDPIRPYNEVEFAVEHLSVADFYNLKSKIVRQGATEAIIDLHANATDPDVKACSAYYGYFPDRPCRGRVSSPEENSLRISFEEASG